MKQQQMILVPQSMSQSSDQFPTKVYMQKKNLKYLAKLAFTKQQRFQQDFVFLLRLPNFVMTRIFVAKKPQKRHQA